MTTSRPTISLNNGVHLPSLGFGVFQTPPDVTQSAVEEALRVGYRMIDTAASYLNEREVGAAIAASSVARSDLFVQTKAWVSDYGYDRALHAFDVSTRKLGLEWCCEVFATGRDPVAADGIHADDPVDAPWAVVECVLPDEPVGGSG